MAKGKYVLRKRHVRKLSKLPKQKKGGKTSPDKTSPEETYPVKRPEEWKTRKRRPVFRIRPLLVEYWKVLMAKNFSVYSQL